MNIIKEINTLLPDLKKKFGVLRIGVFGSHINGIVSPDSDIDVLVTFQDNEETFDNYMDLKFFLEERFGKKVDLVIEDTIKSRIKKKILNEAVYA